MALRSSLVAVSLALTLSFTPSFATSQATIKKANGSVVRGELQGTLVQRSAQRTAVGSGAYGALFIKVAGKDVISIDEHGVRWGNQSQVEQLIIVQKDSVDDLAALNASADFDLLIGYRVKTGASINQSTGHIDPNPNPTPLLGELRRVDGTFQVVPAISVKVGQSVVSIAVSDIVKFKTSAQR